MLVNVIGSLFIGSLVLIGIVALFLTMPLKDQPAGTQLLAELSWAYLRYGPRTNNVSMTALVPFSSVAVLLACVPLFDALRSSGRKIFAVILLAPLALFSLLHIGQAGGYLLGISRGSLAEIWFYTVYFSPDLLVGQSANYPMSVPPANAVVEDVKWCIVLTIAVWLTIAQFAAWRRRKKIRDV
jgi:hypothetical protein